MAVQIGVLPDDILQTIQTEMEGSTSRSFIRLPHPRTGLSSMFLPLQTQSGSSIAELQSVEPVNSRSWFIGNDVVSDGKLLMILPVDPTFLLIPILRSFTPKDGSLGQFRTSDDIFEEAALKLEQTSSKDPSEVILTTDIATFTSLECCKVALPRICEMQAFPPDITVYRFSPTKLVEYLQLKVQNLLKSGVIDGSRTLVRNLAKDGLMEDGNEKLLQAGRLKIACDLVAQYLPSDLRALLIAAYNFSELDAYMNKLEEETRLQVQAANTKSRAKAVAKTPSVDKVDKRKAPKASQGVEKLKKANINGMSKLSTFFTKK